MSAAGWDDGGTTGGHGRGGGARHHVLVGVGSPDRGDDAIGPEVIALIAEWVAGGSMGVHAPGRRPFSLPAGTQVLSRSDPTRLIDVLADADLAVIIDAVRTGGPPGTVHVLQAGADQPGPPAAGTGAAPGTHGIGVGDALALARALGRLPERVVIVGVEAERFEMGTPPSAAVQAALVPAARAALHALGHDAPFDVTEPHGRRPHPSSAPPPEPPPDQPRG